MFPCYDQVGPVQWTARPGRCLLASLLSCQAGSALCSLLLPPHSLLPSLRPTRLLPACLAWAAVTTVPRLSRLAALPTPAALLAAASDMLRMRKVYYCNTWLRINPWCRWCRGCGRGGPACLTGWCRGWWRAWPGLAAPQCCGRSLACCAGLPSLPSSR